MSIFCSAVNPSLVQVTYKAIAGKQGRLKLNELNGRVHFSKVSTFAKGQNICHIDTKRLATGIYIVRILYADGAESEKVQLNK